MTLTSNEQLLILASIHNNAVQCVILSVIQLLAYVVAAVKIIFIIRKAQGNNENKNRGSICQY